MTVGGGELTVEVEATADTDAEELALLTNRLRVELLGLDVEAVYLASGGQAPDSSKGVGPLAAAGWWCSSCCARICSSRSSTASGPGWAASTPAASS